MSRLISVDPGKAGTGWACFANGQLVWAGIITDVDTIEKLTRSISRIMCERCPDKTVVEVPQIYQQRHWKGDPNDLVDVAVIAGAVAGLAAIHGLVELVRPHAWKGNRPKEVDNQYTVSKLSSNELTVLNECGASKSKLHNVVDAVGIGLWKLGRR